MEVDDDSVTSEMQVSNDLGSDSDDEGPIIMRRKKKNMNSSLLDDSDEDEKNDTNKMLQSSDSESNQSVKSSPKRKNKRIMKKILDESSDEEDDSIPAAVNKSVSNSTPNKAKPLNSDLFDAEDSSDGDDPNNDEKPSQTRNGASSGEDECRESEHGGTDEDEEPEISEELRRKLAKLKGAAKKPSKARSSQVQNRPKREDVMELHSESQRIMRESHVRMSYHQPAKIGLNVFLQRTKDKQEALKAIPNAKMAIKKPTTASSLLGSRIKNPATVDRVELKTASCDKKDDSVAAAKECNNVDDIDDELGEDELPDLSLSERITKKQDEEREAAKTRLFEDVDSEDKPENGDVLSENIDDKPSDESPKPVSRDSDSVSQTDMDIAETLSKDEANEHSKVKLKPEDSGYLTHVNTSEEENSGDSSHGVKVEENPDAMVVVLTPTQEKKSETKVTPKLPGGPFLPRLSGGPDDFVDLDDGEEKPKASPGVTQLMERLMKHATKKQKKGKDVEMSTVRKETGDDGKEELKLEKFTYHVDEEEEEDPELKTPGAKLCRLKEKLQEQMKQKRKEARQVRSELACLDNEEGYEEVDEEAELTDQTDTDVEEFDEEEEVMEEEQEQEQPEKEANPFVDDEAEDEDEDDLVEDHLHLELDTPADSQDAVNPKEFLKSALQKQKTLELFDEDANTESPKMSQKSESEKTEVSDRPFEQLSQGKSFGEVVSKELERHGSVIEDEKDETNTSLASSLFKDRDASLVSEASIDLIGTQIPAGQRTGVKHKHRSGDYGRDTPDLLRTVTPDLYTPSSKGSLCKSHSKTSDLQLPIEDSQDLMSLNSAQAVGSTPKMGKADSFHFQLDDSTTMSQMLDADGLLKTSSSKKRGGRRQLLMGGGNNSDDDDELLALCSGQFSAATQKTQSKNPFALGATQSNSTENLNEILGLCSGQFTGSTQKPSDNDMDSELLGLCSGKFTTQKVTGAASTQGGNMDELLGLCSGKFSGAVDSKDEDKSLDTQNQAAENDSPVKVKTKKGKAVIVDEDEEESHEASFTLDSDGEADDAEDRDELGSDEEEPHEEEMAAVFGFGRSKKKKSAIRAAFAEDEAELSGSEADSDENEEGEEDDELEAMSGDEDMQDVDQEELRNQVGRVHLKANIDRDKREIAMLQEMYLQDGDLHTDGKGRMRRFKWKNIDEDSQQDLFKSDEEDGGKEEEEVAEEKWRKERFEREKFLQEQQKEKEEEQEQDSQLLKLGKVVLKTKKPTTSKPATIQPAESTSPLAEKKSSSQSLFKVPTLRKSHGSFLKRGAANLAKIAEMSKPVKTGVGGAKNSGNFVFQAKSQDNSERPEEEENFEPHEKKPQQVKRSISVQQPKPKRPRLEKSNSIPSDSIFNLF